MSQQHRLRLAPTPSGLLHIGNGVNFVLTAASARALDAELWLRVDDLDAARVRGEYLNDIEETIQYLLPGQLARQVLDHKVHQSARLAEYDAALQVLRQHHLVYACACSRRDLRAAQEAAGVEVDVNSYLGTCRDKAIDLGSEGVVWRFRSEEPAGDFVVRQRDGRPSYQLASLVDDVSLDMTHLVRGIDLESSTARQGVLAKALSEFVPDYSAFAKTRCFHHPLLRSPSGEKLSKSAGADALRNLRRSGMQSEAVYYEAARLLDPKAECYTLDQLTSVVSRVWELA